MGDGMGVSVGGSAVGKEVWRVASTLRTAVAVGLASATMKPGKLLHALANNRSAAIKVINTALPVFIIYPKFIPNLIWDKFGINKIHFDAAEQHMRIKKSSPQIMDYQRLTW